LLHQRGNLGHRQRGKKKKYRIPRKLVFLLLWGDNASHRARLKVECRHRKKRKERRDRVMPPGKVRGRGQHCPVSVPSENSKPQTYVETRKKVRGAIGGERAKKVGQKSGA